MKTLGTGLLLLVFLTLAAPLAWCNPLEWQEDGFKAVGIRSGFTAIKRKEFFRLYEVFASYGLPWSVRGDSGWGVALQVDATLGELRAAHESAVAGSFGPGVIIDKAGNRGLALMFGGDLNLMSRHKFGSVDLNGNPLFLGHIGLAYRFESGPGIEYQFQHISNGGLGLHGDGNTGLDLHMFGVSWNF